MIIVQQEPQFKIQSLFHKEFTNLINEKNFNNLLVIKPNEFWKKLVNTAKKYYQYKLEPELIKIKCRDSYRNKIALLRELWLAVGIKVKSRNYNLIESIVEESKELSSNVPKKNSKTSSKKGTLKYDLLPFSSDDIVEIVPIIKHLEVTNTDFNSFINNAKSAMKEGFYEQAFEFVNQAINVNLQVAGPINKEAATCLSMLANIHFKFGEYMQMIGSDQAENYMASYTSAIQLQSKAVLLYEKLYGKAHPLIAQAYVALHKFNNKVRIYDK